MRLHFSINLIKYLLFIQTRTMKKGFLMISPNVKWISSYIFNKHHKSAQNCNLSTISMVTSIIEYSKI